MIPRLAPGGQDRRHAARRRRRRHPDPAARRTAGTRHQPFCRDCCQYCCPDGGQHLTRMDRCGISAQRTDHNGRSWTMCPLLRIRRLGVRVPPSTPVTCSKQQLTGPAPGISKGRRVKRDRPHRTRYSSCTYSAATATSGRGPSRNRSGSAHQRCGRNECTGCLRARCARGAAAPRRWADSAGKALTWQQPPHGEAGTVQQACTAPPPDSRLPAHFANANATTAGTTPHRFRPRSSIDARLVQRPFTSVALMPGLNCPASNDAPRTTRCLAQEGYRPLWWALRGRPYGRGGVRRV